MEMDEMNSRNNRIATSETEKLLLKIWSWVLSIPEAQLTIDDDFFNMGGDAVKVKVLRRKIKKVIGREISTTQAYAYPTIFELGKFLDSKSEKILDRKKA
jgi:aryl carrier-like protein